MTFLVFLVPDTVRGPLALLHTAVKEKVQVRVWVRRFRGVRGVCQGYIVAFDNHWNLVRKIDSNLNSNKIPKLV